VNQIEEDRKDYPISDVVIGIMENDEARVEAALIRIGNFIIRDLGREMLSLAIFYAETTNMDILVLLMAAGANPNTQDDKGHSIFFDVRDSGNEELLNFLQSHVPEEQFSLAGGVDLVEVEK